MSKANEDMVMLKVYIPESVARKLEDLAESSSKSAHEFDCDINTIVVASLIEYCASMTE